MSYHSEVIYNVMIPNYNVLVNGSSLSLPAHGRAGARTTSSLAALFAKQKTKFGGGTPVVERFAFTTGQEARAGPEGPRSFPKKGGAYEVNKNSCFLLAP